MPYNEVILDWLGIETDERPDLPIITDEIREELNASGYVSVERAEVMLKAFMLRERYGWGCNIVSRELDLPLGTVKSWFWRGREDLKFRKIAARIAKREIRKFEKARN